MENYVIDEIKWAKENMKKEDFIGLPSLIKTVGEVAKAVIEGNGEEYRNKLIEVAAVCIREENSIEEIKAERVRQNQKWGIQNHFPNVWLGILVEEIGEVAQAICDDKIEEYKKELIQVAAVCVQAVYCLDRNGHKLKRLIKEV